MSSIPGNKTAVVNAVSFDLREHRSALAGAVVVVVLLIWMFWDFFRRQMQWAIESPADWGHTLAIPFIAGYIVYLQREKILALPFRTTWFGLIPLVLGVATYILCVFGPQPLDHHNLHGAGVSLSLFGLALLFFGWRAMLYLWFPLAYLCVFGQTVSDRLMNIVTFKLQDWTAIGSYFTLKLTSFDVDIEGNTIFMYDEAGNSIPLNIAQACSGMRMLMAFLALGVVMAFTGLKRWWQRIALVLLAFPTAIFVNILRVVTLAILSLFNADFAAGDFHTFIGLLWLLPAFMIYLGIVWILRNLVIEEDDGPTRKPGTPTTPGTPEASAADAV